MLLNFSQSDVHMQPLQHSFLEERQQRFPAPAQVAGPSQPWRQPPAPPTGARQPGEQGDVSGDNLANYALER